MERTPSRRRSDDVRLRLARRRGREWGGRRRRLRLPLPRVALGVFFGVSRSQTVTSLGEEKLKKVRRVSIVWQVHLAKLPKAANCQKLLHCYP